MKITIIHKSPPRAGTRQELSGKKVFRIGRHPDNDCVFGESTDAGVSGFHAELRVANHRVTVVDLDSTNGIMVDGKKVRNETLTSGQEVKLGLFGPAFVVEFATGKVDPSEVTAPMEQMGPGREKPGERKYGQRTVGMMIQQALAQAGLITISGASKSTQYFEALVDKKVKSTSSRLKGAVFAAIAAVVVIGGAVTYYLYSTRSVQIVHNYGDAVGGSIAAANRFTVFLMAGRPAVNGRPAGELQGFCTAFAVAQDVLATNAHCVLSARELFTEIAVIMNGSLTGRYPVAKMVHHPAYQKGALSPDVGLMRIQGKVEHIVRMASPQELSQVSPGVPVFLYGFPGRLNKADAPEATFTKGDIGRVTTFAQRLGDFGQNTLLQHSAYSASGTSGSPIFNSQGSAIGINAGGYLEDGQKMAGYNFAMRIDLVNDLFALLGPV